MVQVGRRLRLRSDEVAYSQAGRVVDEKVNGTDAYAGTGAFGSPGSQNFAYDPLGRLITARIPGHEYSYGYGPVAGCTLAPNAGANTNRTSVNDNGALLSTSCYDRADRLASSTDPGVGAPTYDTRGNTVTLSRPESDSLWRISCQEGTWTYLLSATASGAFIVVVTVQDAREVGRQRP